MEELYDDSKFHDISFEEFQEMIDQASEVEIPLDSFQDFVDEMNSSSEDSFWDINNYLSYAEVCLSEAKYSEAFSVAYQYRKAVPQDQQERLYGIYDVCSEHGILDASILLADHYFERWEAPDIFRGKAFKYLHRIYKAGYLPYYWKLGYCYLNGMGVLPNRLQAKSIFMDGMLYGGDDICAGYLGYLVPEIEGALEDATKMYFDRSDDYNYKRAYDLYLNAVIHSCKYDMGYPLMRMADIQMEHNVDKDITPRKCFLMYRSALKLGVWDAPEADIEFDEDEIYYKLGEMYFDGYGTKKDFYKAAYFLKYGWHKQFDRDDAALARREKYIKEALEKAELLSNDDEEWEYYKECFEKGDIDDPFGEYVEPEDNFLYL